MKIIRNGMEFELTPAELEQAFREQERNYKSSNAENHLREWGDREFFDEEHFAYCVGFTLDEVAIRILSISCRITWSRPLRSSIAATMTRTAHGMNASPMCSSHTQPM